MKSPATRWSRPAAAWALFFLLLLGACSGTVPPPAPADTIVEEEWKEVELHLPAYPKDADLLPMLLSKGVAERILIDSGSISVGRDDVVRYTVVIEGSGGARNIFYEGIRCTTREYKRFAYGTAERTFAPMTNATWEKIYNHGLGAFRYEAFRYYFCGVAGAAEAGRTLSPAEIVRGIRYPGPVFKSE